MVVVVSVNSDCTVSIAAFVVPITSSAVPAASSTGFVSVPPSLSLDIDVVLRMSANLRFSIGFIPRQSISSSVIRLRSDLFVTPNWLTILSSYCSSRSSFSSLYKDLDDVNFLGLLLIGMIRVDCLSVEEVVGDLVCLLSLHPIDCGCVVDNGGGSLD